MVAGEKGPAEAVGIAPQKLQAGMMVRLKSEAAQFPLLDPRFRRGGSRDGDVRQGEQLSRCPQFVKKGGFKGFARLTEAQDA